MGLLSLCIRCLYSTLENYYLTQAVKLRHLQYRHSKPYLSRIIAGLLTSSIRNTSAFEGRPAWLHNFLLGFREGGYHDFSPLLYHIAGDFSLWIRHKKAVEYTMKYVNDKKSSSSSFNKDTVVQLLIERFHTNIFLNKDLTVALSLPVDGCVFVGVLRLK